MYGERMVRRTYQLTPEHLAILRGLAARWEITEAEVIRRLIERGSR